MIAAFCAQNVFALMMTYWHWPDRFPLDREYEVDNEEWPGQLLPAPSDRTLTINKSSASD
jgi:hypothetical protein